MPILRSGIIKEIWHENNRKKTKKRKAIRKTIGEIKKNKVKIKKIKPVKRTRTITKMERKTIGKKKTREERQEKQRERN